MVKTTANSKRHAIVVVLALGLTACSEETSPPAPTSETRPATSQPHLVEWLELNSAISPAQWLASRGETHLRSPDDPDVQRIGRDLAAAHAVYRESERMIANRAVQLEGMLKTLAVEQDAPSILADLVSIPGEIGQTEGFGAVTQHYFNLRANRAGRTDALAALKERYGTRRSEQ